MAGSAICVDASLVLRLVMGPDDSQAWELFSAWTSAGRQLVAPSLLAYEVVNGLHRYHRAGYLSPASAELSLDAILSLPIELTNEPRLHLRALTLARELSLPATYDAQYLALAEDLKGEFWTADRRLVAAVQDKLPWVRGIEDRKSESL